MATKRAAKKKPVDAGALAHTGPMWIITSDWHADAVSYGMDRGPDLERFADKIIVEVKEHDARLFFLGDLCNPTSPRAPRAIALAVHVVEQLAACPQPVWLVGNHDVVEDGNGGSTLSPLEKLGERAHVVTGPFCEVFDGAVVGYFPHVERSATYDPVKHVEFCATIAKGDPTARVVAMGHLAVEGAQMGSEVDMPRGQRLVMPVATLRGSFKAVTIFNGHYHGQQTTKSGVIIPGSPERLRASEADNTPSFIRFWPQTGAVEVVPWKGARPIVTIGSTSAVWSTDKIAKQEGAIVVATPPPGYDPKVLEALRPSCAVLHVLPPSQGLPVGVMPKEPAAPAQDAAAVVRRLVAAATVPDKPALVAAVESIMQEVGL